MVACCPHGRQLSVCAICAPEADRLHLLSEQNRRTIERLKERLDELRRKHDIPRKTKPKEAARADLRT